jgi:hypothetical protein
MARLYLFADEAGDFEFTRRQNVSRYFILCSVTMANCGIGASLLGLRRELAWAKAPLGEYFHATTDKQQVRDAVFAEILKWDFSIQAIVMEKDKAFPQVRTDKPTFYKYGWHYHLRHSLRSRLRGYDELLVMAASISTRRGQTAFSDSVRQTLNQHFWQHQWRAYFCPAQTDPCLQVADYCAWAIQRKWERGDTLSYDLISNRITYEFDLWAHGTRRFY